MSNIYNEDCREVLARMADESVDGVFTDPPFNINLKPQRKTHGKIANDALPPEDFERFINETFISLFRVLRPNRVAWVCCNWQCCDIFNASLKQAGFTVKTWIVWVKNNFGLGNHFRPQHEFIIVAFKGEPPVPETAFSNVWYEQRETNTLHPNEKPVKLIVKALRIYNKEGDLIVDPFAGSFSTCVAAKALGMSYEAAEILPHHFEHGKARLEGTVQFVNDKGTLVSRSDSNPLMDYME